MLLETLLANNQPPHEITHIFIREHITFFRIHNESFCCAASHIYHKSSPMFDNAPLKIWAEQAHDEDTKAEWEKMKEECADETELWSEHEQQILQTVFLGAFQALDRGGPEAFMEFVNHHITVMPEKGALTILKRLAQ